MYLLGAAHKSRDIYKALHEPFGHSMCLCDLFLYPLPMMAATGSCDFWMRMEQNLSLLRKHTFLAIYSSLTIKLNKQQLLFRTYLLIQIQISINSDLTFGYLGLILGLWIWIQAC